MQGYTLNQVVKMKKPHPCGANAWKIIRVGADFRIKCMSCERSIMIPRTKFVKQVKKVLSEEEVKKELNN
ncbi:DUF951 domain-containing protein [Natranaerobius trueperi]|uniref:DUF951 domain-containing protein n=1 Tax=Natranaerobius trueperi TaxID=759412 RepID=A0A226BZ59_9FIRM|nr:DUF951 domain-containing protein [Natranaerobius trueperi]OWZ83489.1 hypothetical protein CDO51_08305 [Natranaerobius trueperi]